MAPLAAWCKADYIEKRVKKIIGKENKIELDDGTTVDYDILSLNVGSRTRGTNYIEGIWDYSLTTRPINDLLPKIHKRQAELVANN